MRMIGARIPPALLACAGGLALGLPPAALITRLRCWAASCSHQTCASACSPAVARSAEPIGLVSRAIFAGEPVIPGPILARVRRANIVALSHGRCVKRSDASLDVSVPFSACRPRCAVRGGQASGRSRSDVSHRSATRAFHGTQGPSPTDGVLAVFRFSDAMRLCSMWGLAPLAVIATFRAA